MSTISRERCRARRWRCRRASIRACVVARAIAPVDAPKIRAELQRVVLPDCDRPLARNGSNVVGPGPTLQLFRSASSLLAVVCWADECVVRALGGDQLRKIFENNVQHPQCRRYRSTRRRLKWLRYL